MTHGPAVARIVDAAERLDRKVVPKQGGVGLMVQCPSHDDRTPSLSVDEGQGGKALVCCQAGCSTNVVLDALGLPLAALYDDYGDEANGHVRVDPPSRPKPQLPNDDEVRGWSQALQADPRIAQRLVELRGWTPEVITNLGIGFDGERLTFPVRSGGGQLVGLVKHLPNPEKRNGAAKVKAAAGSQREFFPAPEAVESGQDFLFVVEGEPDAVAGASLGIPTVGLPGVKAWRKAWAKRFAGRNVAVLLDCDEPGRECAQTVAADIAQVARRVVTLDLDPARTDGYDVGDLCREAQEAGDLEGAAGLLRSMATEATPIQGPTPKGRRLVTHDLRFVRPEATQWLWRDRIPLGTVSLLGGRPGLGKSTLTMRLAAALSRGELAGALNGTPATTLLFSYEDHLARTIHPRLLASNADVSKVIPVAAADGDDAELATWPEDTGRLLELVNDTGAKLVVIDPLVAGTATGVDSHNDHSVRRALAPLAAAAQEGDFAVLATMHLNKGNSRDFLERLSGSVAYGGLARSVLGFGRDPHDPDQERGRKRVLVVGKSNLAPDNVPALLYRVESKTVPGYAGQEIGTSALEYEGESEATGADLLMEAGDEERTKTEVAIEFLEASLADGEWRPSKDVKAAAKAEEVSDSTLHRARKRLKVQDRTGDEFPRVTEWRLPVIPRGVERLESAPAGTTSETRIPEQDQGEGEGVGPLPTGDGTTERLGAVR